MPDFKPLARVWAMPLALLAVCAYLSLQGLDNTLFWDDESETAFFGRNLVKFGRLTGWDGRNLWGYRDGSLLDDQLRPINPPLQYVVCAASFGLFGETTWTGRLPFVAAGLAALIVFWLAVRRDFGDDRWAAFYTLAAFGLSVNFLLNIRQCRYNALAILFALLTYYAYRRLLADRRPGHAVLLAASALLLFFSHYLIGMAFLLALAVTFLVFDRTALDRQAWRALLLAVVLFAAIAGLLGFHWRIWRRPDLGSSEPFPLRQVKLIWWNIRDLNLAAFLPWPIAAGALGAAVLRWRKDATVRAMARWGVLGLANTVFVGLLSPQPTWPTVVADLRYLLASLPFLAGLTGAFLRVVHRWNRHAAMGLLAVLISCNALTLCPLSREFRWLLPAYVREIHGDYPTSFSVALDCLKKRVQQDDLVFAVPAYRAGPLLYYLGDRARFGCVLDNPTTLPKKVVDSLDAPLWCHSHFPKWIVSFGRRQETADTLAYFSRPHDESGQTVTFRYSLSETLNVFAGLTDRPELPFHHFGPITDVDLENEAVYVFARYRGVF